MTSTGPLPRRSPRSAPWARCCSLSWHVWPAIAAGRRRSRSPPGPHRDRPRRRGRRSPGSRVARRDLATRCTAPHARAARSRSGHAGRLRPARASPTRPSANGTTYFYARPRESDDGASPTRRAASRRPRRGRARCSTGNAIVQRELLPGLDGVEDPGRPPGVARRHRGLRCRRRASTPAAASTCASSPARDVPYRVEIYRTGHYGGDQGRLISRDARPSTARTSSLPTASRDHRHRRLRRTGASARPSRRPPTGPSGVYLLKLDPRGQRQHNETLLVVRDDASHSDVALHGPDVDLPGVQQLRRQVALHGARAIRPTTVSARRARSRCRSTGRTPSPPGRRATATTGTRAPTSRPSAGSSSRATTSTYIANEDLHANGARAPEPRGPDLRRPRRVLVAGDVRRRHRGARRRHVADLHRRQRVVLARPLRQRARRPASPTAWSSATRRSRAARWTRAASRRSTWRDPAGPNQPENELHRPDVRRREHRRTSSRCASPPPRASNRIWRYTRVADARRRRDRAIGTGIVGWEWDSRVDNGREPGRRADRRRPRPVRQPDPEQRRVPRRPATPPPTTTLYRRPAARSSSRPAPTTGGAASPATSTARASRTPASSRRR